MKLERVVIQECVNLFSLENGDIFSFEKDSEKYVYYRLPEEMNKFHVIINCDKFISFGISDMEVVETDSKVLINKPSKDYIRSMDMYQLFESHYGRLYMKYSQYEIVDIESKERITLESSDLGAKYSLVRYIK